MGFAALLVLNPIGQSTDDPITFQVTEVDSSRLALEPVISLNSSDGQHLSGMVELTSTDGNYWTKATGWSYENPPTTGGIDAVVFAATEGTYFAELDASQSRLQTARKGTSWPGTPVSISGLHDRPWLAEYSGDVYLLTSRSVDSGHTVQLRKTTDDGATWSDVNLGIVTIGSGAGNLTINRNGTFFFAYFDGENLKTAYSTNQGTDWNLETASSANGLVGVPFTSLDADGNLFLVTHDGSKVKYLVRWASNGTWSSLIDVSRGSDTTTWGPSIAANGTGELAVAWYTKTTLGDWEVHYTRIADAHAARQFSAETPVFLAAEGSKIEENVFRDFLTLSHERDGDVVIAFSCNWTLLTVDPPPCNRDSVSHPMIAHQSGGPRI